MVFSYYNAIRINTDDLLRYKMFTSDTVNTVQVFSFITNRLR